MSKQLDDELAQVAGLDSNEAEYKSGGATAPVAHVVGERHARKTTGASLGLLAVLLVIAGSLVALFMFGFKDAAIYAMPVDQLLSQQDKLMNRKVRITGELVPKTLEKRDKPCEYRFKLHGQSDQPLTVSYPQCVVTESLRDVPGGGVEVTVEGALKPHGAFEASLVMAKCTSKYDPKTHQMNPEGPRAENAPIN